MTIVDYPNHYVSYNSNKVTNTEQLVPLKLVLGVCIVLAFCGLKFVK